MVKRFAWLVAVTVVALSAIIVFGTVAYAASTLSGERIHGQSALEPVFDDVTGNAKFIMTPLKAPLNANPRAWAPFYVPVYPISASASVGTLQCTHTPADNCPDHGPPIAAAAASIVPSVYGSGVLGHDHLLAPPGSGIGQFNVAWEPILVLFTNAAVANTRLTTLAQINALVNSSPPLAIEVPLPQLTFHCEVVPEIVYTNSIPVTPV